MSEIEVVSSSLIGVATSSSYAVSRIELTPWDLRLLHLGPIQKGLLYRNPESQLIFKKSLVDHLKVSLSRALDFFHPLAGRLGTLSNVDGTVSFFLDCNNAGVEFTHAVASSVSVSDILEPAYVPKIVSSLFPLNGFVNCKGVSKPLLGVQVTVLTDGYFVGCTANHSVIDGNSFWHFLNSWSEISRGSDSISKMPVLDRWFPSDVSHSNRLIPVPAFENEILHSDNVSTAPLLLERVFHFSKANIAKLKAKANLEVGTDKISSLQALTTHLWRSVIRSRSTHSSNNENQEICCLLVIGARTRIPLPDGYFGNAVYGARLSTTEDNLLADHGLGSVALKLNELVARQTQKEAIKFVEDWVKNPHVVQKGVNSFMINSSPRHDVYGNDFGWGKPVAVRAGFDMKFDGMMTVFPASPDSGGGIDVEACLAPQTLMAMGEDGEFMEVVTI